MVGFHLSSNSMTSFSAALAVASSSCCCCCSSVPNSLSQHNVMMPAVNGQLSWHCKQCYKQHCGTDKMMPACSQCCLLQILLHEPA